MTKLGTLLIACALLVLGSAQLSAHPANMGSAQAAVQADGSFTLSVTFDALAFALNDTPDRVRDSDMLALMDGPRAELERRMESARTRFARHALILADDRPVAPSAFLFPSADDVLRTNSRSAMRLPVLLSCEMRGTLPLGTTAVTIQLPEVLGTMVLSVETPGGDVITAPLTENDATLRVPVRLTNRATNAVAAADAATTTDRRLNVRRFFATVASMISLGFRHILPRGIDHVLFVLGLFLLAGRLSALLWQVTAFTTAHTLTLGLSLYGVVRLPASVVEPLIALSIVLVAVDNIRGKKLRWWRVAVVFGFGLIHGMGFAGALLDLGLPRSQYIPALLGFNVGVELGQLTVIALSFAAVGWFRNLPQYRRYVVIPASAVIGCIALVWTIQRL